MSRKFTFFWIDDSPERRKVAKSMAEALNVDIIFFGLNKKNVVDELETILKNQEPDLILMDHRLNLADSDTVATGSSATAIVREKWYLCPIVSITNIEKNEMDSRHRSAYEDIFPGYRIAKNYDRIKSIATGFNALRKNYPKSYNDILDHFKSPENEKSKMTKILPIKIKENLDDKSLLVEIYRWYKSILLQRPGFLYDRIWTSTLLGLNPAGFQKVETNFKSAKYQGIFANDLDERWWKSDILSILGRRTNELGLPWVIGRTLVDKKKAYISKCYVSKKEFPETVAATDTTNDAEWHPMKLKYTESHPYFENMLFFEEMRIMKPGE